MISFFPDLNVWIALSVSGHSHSREAWNWINLLPREAKLVFSRYTHIGFLRLLTNESAMGEQTLTLLSTLHSGRRRRLSEQKRLQNGSLSLKLPDGSALGYATYVSKGAATDVDAAGSSSGRWRGGQRAGGGPVVFRC